MQNIFWCTFIHVYVHTYVHTHTAKPSPLCRSPRTVAVSSALTGGPWCVYHQTPPGRALTGSKPEWPLSRFWP